MEEASQQRDCGPSGPQPAARGELAATSARSLSTPPVASLYDIQPYLSDLQMTTSYFAETPPSHSFWAARGLKLLRQSLTPINSTGADVGAFFRAQAEEATHSHWQIIQVAETSSPGKSEPHIRSLGMCHSVYLPFLYSKYRFCSLLYAWLRAALGTSVQ